MHLPQAFHLSIERYNALGFLESVASYASEYYYIVDISNASIEVLD